MGKEVARRGPKSLPELIDSSEVRIQEILPDGMSAKRVIRLAKLAIHKEPKLLQCDPISVIQAIMTASTIGLEINSPLGGAHLVPFGNQCVLVPDYRGLVRLALQSGGVVKLVAREVYADDHFDVVQGSDEKLVHIPNVSAEARKPEDIIAFYAIATLPDHSTVHEWRPRGDVDAIRDRAKGSNSGPWKTDYAAMGKKTLVKQLCRWLDLSPQFAEAVEHDNRADGYETGSLEADTPESIQERMREQARVDAEAMRASMEGSGPQED